MLPPRVSLSLPGVLPNIFFFDSIVPFVCTGGWVLPQPNGRGDVRPREGGRRQGGSAAGVGLLQGMYRYKNSAKRAFYDGKFVGFVVRLVGPSGAFCFCCVLLVPPSWSAAASLNCSWSPV